MKLVKNSRKMSSDPKYWGNNDLKFTPDGFDLSGITKARLIMSGYHGGGYEIDNISAKSLESAFGGKSSLDKYLYDLKSGSSLGVIKQGDCLDFYGYDMNEGDVKKLISAGTLGKFFGHKDAKVDADKLIGDASKSEPSKSEDKSVDDALSDVPQQVQVRVETMFKRDGYNKVAGYFRNQMRSAERKYGKEDRRYKNWEMQARVLEKLRSSNCRRIDFRKSR